MQIIERYDRQFEYGGILMNLFVAYQFFTLWFDPQINDTGRLATLSVMMLFEFVMVHSGVFMALMPKKLSLYILFPIYGLFALAINSMAENNIVLIAYLLVVFNRMRFAFSDVSKEIRNRIITTSVLGALIYFFMLFFFLLAADYIPKFGLTDEFLKITGYGRSIYTEGAFVDIPHAIMAFGLCYYSSLALIEALFLNRNFAPKPTRKLSKR
ncbi:hypothetical protein [Pseudozobellia thermophila]|uniref:Uncharacterized protein n=1 Tax=Pseudozobellia thermophila TaxID=192903 RepID=A0A1M6BYE6_9FLAO|nr:hypothetical protein [Pseudozobellia thermophila]SHI53544.1 hypothetical protein SAMN04488513_101572 [Pseudozobellia thermophila]